MRVMLVTGFFPGERMGGAEYQTSLIGSGLAAQGHDVLFLGTDTGGEGNVLANGMTVRQIPGWRTTGWIQHRRRLSAEALEFKPDICYVRLLPELAVLSDLCREMGVPVVSSSSSLREVSPFLTGYHPREAVALLRAGRVVPHFRSFRSIRFSAAHVCNTEALRQRLRRWFPRRPIAMIYNGSPVPGVEETHLVTTGQVIWVNNLKPWKRPELFVELARRLPQYRFVMIGAMHGGRLYKRRLKKMLDNAPPNLRYRGPQSLEKVNDLIGQSDLLVYTSKAAVEGFGNSFLQAWFRGVPTLSLEFDLDGILDQEGVGRLSPSFERLVADVRDLMEHEESRQQMGQRARVYALRHHTSERLTADFDALFQKHVAEHRG